MIAAAVTALAIAAAAPVQPADLAGTYRIGQMEMAGGLELRADGRFRYALDYGAASETAEGNWTVRGQTLELTSDPVPRAPDFALVEDQPAPSGELYVALQEGALNWSPIDVLVELEGAGEPLYIQAGADGRLAIPERQRAKSIRLLVPVYEIAGTAIPISGEHGHRLLFRFEANDLGKVAFDRQPLAIDGTSLIMNRYETKIVFRRGGQ